MITKYTYQILAVFLVSLTLSSKAQKLNEVQEKGVLAPTKVKVDGKPLEWPATFEAYNKSTMVYYTLANDDKNLYLIVQSKDKTTTNKIMRGGITFSINKEGKKKENDGPAITFPVVNTGGGMRSMVQGMRPAGSPGQGSGPIRIEMTPDNIAQMMKRADSAMNEANKRQIATLREIKVIRLNGISDSLISIYNEYGVKAMAAFDSAGVYTYELAVPLESLGLTKGNSQEFAYNLKLNGLQLNTSRVSGSQAGAVVTERIVVMGSSSGAGGAMPSGMGDMMSMLSPTYLWGKYTLVGN